MVKLHFLVTKVHVLLQLNRPNQYVQDSFRTDNKIRTQIVITWRHKLRTYVTKYHIHQHPNPKTEDEMLNNN